MTRKELAGKIVDVLDENGIRKAVPTQRAVFHITDDNGNKSDFTVKKDHAGVRYTVDDINTILEACVEVVIDAMRRGDKISISGFGSLYLKYRAARSAPHPLTGETYEMKEHFTVKFDPGKYLKTAAANYSASYDEMYKNADDVLCGKVGCDDYEEDVMFDGRN